MEEKLSQDLVVVLGILAALLLVCVLWHAGTCTCSGRSAGQDEQYEYGGTVPRIQHVPEGATPSRFPTPDEVTGGALVIEVTPKWGRRMGPDCARVTLTAVGAPR